MSLRELLAAATPGPWIACGHNRGGCQCGNVWSEPGDVPVASAITEEKLNEAGWSRNRKEQLHDDARLIALAPELCALACDMADELRVLLAEHPQSHEASELLERFAELERKAGA